MLLGGRIYEHADPDAAWSHKIPWKNWNRIIKKSLEFDQFGIGGGTKYGELLKIIERNRQKSHKLCKLYKQSK